MNNFFWGGRGAVEKFLRQMAQTLEKIGLYSTLG